MSDHQGSEWPQDSSHPLHLRLKLARARSLLASMTELIESHGHLRPALGRCGSALSHQVDGPNYRIIMTANCALKLTRRPNNIFEESRVFDTDWTLLELYIRSRRSLALHTLNDELELVEFIPGEWERWFGGDAMGDTTPFKLSYVPKSLADLDSLRSQT